MTHLNLHMMENCSNAGNIKFSDYLSIEPSEDKCPPRKIRAVDRYTDDMSEKLEKLFINIQEYCDMMNWPNSDKSQIVIDLKTENVIVDEKKMEEFL